MHSKAIHQGAGYIPHDVHQADLMTTTKSILEKAGAPLSFEERGLTVEGYRKHLRDAFCLLLYIDPSQCRESLVAKTLHQMGRTFYNACYKSCLAILMGAFFIQANALESRVPGLEWSNVDSLEELQQSLTNNQADFIARLDKQLKEWSPSSFAAAIDRHSAEERIQLASTLRWIGHSLMNLNEFNTHSPENTWRLKTIYKSCKAILEPLAHQGNTDAISELGELIYNMAPGLHSRKTPNDVQGAAAKLDKVFAFDNSPAMRARIANKKACMLPAKEALAHSEEALRLWTQEVNPAEVDPFLLANCRNTCARLWMSCGNDADYPRIEELLNLAVRHADECQAAGNDHYYFAIYFINYAGFELMRNNVDEAQKWVDRAAANINAFPESSASLMENFQKVKTLCALLKPQA